MINCFHSCLPLTEQRLNTVFPMHTQTIFPPCILLFLSEQRMLRSYPIPKLYLRKSLFISSLMFHYVPGITFLSFLIVDCTSRPITFLKFLEFPLKMNLTLLFSLSTLHNYHVLPSLHLHMNVFESRLRAGIVLLSSLCLGIKLAQEGTHMSVELCIFVYAYLFQLPSFEMWFIE